MNWFLKQYFAALAIALRSTEFAPTNFPAPNFVSVNNVNYSYNINIKNEVHTLGNVINQYILVNT